VGKQSYIGGLSNRVRSAAAAPVSRMVALLITLSMSCGLAHGETPQPKPVAWWLSNVANDGPGPRGAAATPGGNCERCLKASGVTASPAWTGALTRVGQADFDSIKGCQFHTDDGKTQDNGCIVARSMVCADGYQLSGNACVEGLRDIARRKDVRTFARGNGKANRAVQ
jgi:hypothetical protein